MRILNAISKFMAIVFFLFSVSIVFAQGTQPQTIKILPIQDQVYGVAPFQIIAIASSGLPVTLTASGPAILKGRLLTVTGPGTVTITAQQPGNQDYAPASAQISFTVKQGIPSVQWNPGTIIYGTPLDSSVLNASASATPGFDPTADSPTITTQVGTSQLTGGNTPNYLFSDSVFRYEGPPMVESGGGKTPQQQITIAHSYRVAFTCNCQQFEFVLRNGGGYYGLWVDGSWISTQWSPQIQSTKMGFYRVQFPDQRPREIKILIDGRQPFYGVITSGTDTISPPEVPLNLANSGAIIFGDSWTAPTVIDPTTGQGINAMGYGQILSEYFNWNFFESGEGGSGFVNTGAYQPFENFVQREQTDICYDPGPAIVVIVGGVNDRFSSESSIEQNATQFFSQLQSCLPQAKVFMVGPQMFSSGGSISNVETALAAATANFPNIPYEDPTADNWFYGDPSNSNTGNEYLYFNATGSHPTPLGHDYWAEKMVDYILSIDPSLAPQTYPLFNPTSISGTYSYSVANGTLLPAGQHQVSVTFTPQDSVHYATVTQNATITVAKASSSVTLTASATSVNLGNTLVVTAKVSPQIGGIPTGTVTFFDNGNPIGTAPLDSSGTASLTTSWTTPGNHQLSASYTGDNNFYGSTTPAAISIVVTKPDFTMSTNTTQITVVPGQSAPLILTVTPLSGLSTKLNLTCTGLPANSMCTIQGADQITVTNQQPTTATVLIQAFAPRASVEMQLWKVSGTLNICGLLGTLVFLRKRNKRSWSEWIFLGLLFLVSSTTFFTTMIGCGSGSKIRTPEPGTYTVNLTLTSTTDSSITHSQTVTVVIP